uniref:Ninein n=1 Tax=Callorhinchus milii TaxID=7868 RepID=A0A4W3IMQ0_CALMI
MDEAEQDKYEARLKEVFDSFDTTGTGSLGQEELTDLCHMLQLQEVAPVLLQTLLQGNLSGRVHFEQFKEALILILSTTIEGNFSGDDGYQEPEVQPKYVKDGKRYGRRTAPEFQDSVEEFTEVKVTEPIADGLGPEDATSVDVENWKTSTDQGEEYEAEGQLRFWNPDDLNSCQSMFSADPDWIEERLQAVCEELGVTRDDYPSRKELISICDQIGLQNVDTEVLEELVQKQEQDGLLTVEDFFYGLFKNGQSAPPSASTPYRQLKRHHSLQPFDESGRRTATPSAMTGTIGLRLFSCLDDGTGYTSADQILDAWQEGGIENGLEILKTLDFGPDGKVNLTELTLALENELLITKNGIHQAVLASFKHEIRHLMERVDQVLREKEKLHTDLDKADRLKNLMASEVDDHHAAIERLNECNLRKLEQEHRERLAALKADLTKEKDLILQQASRQSSELEKEIEKVKAEESYLRDRLALSLKENSRLERELLENGEKLVGFENQAKKLQKNLDNVLKEKFGDLDPTSAEFFLHEERFSRLRREYEQQCRELQDRIDELQSELQAYQTQDKSFKQLWGSSLSDEMENKTGAIDCDQGLQSEECNPLNLSLEAEMVIEQIKEQHHQAFESLKVDLETKVRFYEAQIEETKLKYETEEKIIKQKCKEDILQMEKQIDDLKSHISKLQGETEFLKMLQQTTEYKCEEEKRAVQDWFHEEKRQLQEQFKQKHEDTLRIKLDEERRSLHNEKEMLLEKQKSAEIQIEAQRKELIETFLQERAELQQIYEAQISKIEQNMTQEKEELQRDLLEEKQKELCEESGEAEELTEKYATLKHKMTTLMEKERNFHQKITEMNEAQQELIVVTCTISYVKLTLPTVLKTFVPNCTPNQMAETRSRNRQLDAENENLCRKNSKNQADVQDLNRRLADLLRQKEKKMDRQLLEEWELEKSQIMEEMENSRAESSTLISALEADLSEMKLKKHLLEQDKLLLSQQLEDVKFQLSECNRLESEVTSLKYTNEKLIQEKETLSDEVNRCVDRVWKSLKHFKVISLRQEQQTLQQQIHMLTTQLNMSQEKIQSLEETLQNAHFQAARCKSDFRVSQQEKEALKQEVTSLHKELQTTKDENQVLELNLNSADFQHQHKRLYRDDLARLVEKEQQLLRQENERLQREAQHTKGELQQAREKIKYLDSTLLTLKQQKHYNKSAMVKAAEQEKLSLKRECDQIQKELLSANRKVRHKINKGNIFFLSRNIQLEGQRSKRVSKEACLHLSKICLQSQNIRELQQLKEQVCGMVPQEQVTQLQQRLSHEEMQRRQLQEQLDKHAADSNTQQVRSVPSENLPLKQPSDHSFEQWENFNNNFALQMSKNIKADEMIKDLYVENAQLLKALEMSEQRHKTTEKKNYLLEENIAGLNKILKDLSTSSLSAASARYSS